MHLYRYCVLPLVAALQLRRGSDGKAKGGITAGDNPMDVIKEAHEAQKAQTHAAMEDACVQVGVEQQGDPCSWHAVQWGREIKTLAEKIQQKEDSDCASLSQKLKHEGAQYVFSELDQKINDKACDEVTRRTAESLLHWVKKLKEECARLEIKADQCDTNEIKAKEAARAKLKELCKQASIGDKDCTGPKLAAKAAGQFEEKRELQACREAGLGTEHCSTANTVTMTKEELERERLKQRHLRDSPAAPAKSDESDGAVKEDKEPGQPADPVAAPGAKSASAMASAAVAVAMTLSLW